ncbi:MAG: hypothetical protein Harvfovirus42_5 [Harvfovirus sp.]|uniref:Uncharacterized protein n=1 Tax=Harvfovirus sp. TaxID=2487768 RepID=A0A3G5A2Z9_9VIRU|nr:MAG: hypothetical protein Harvfovirus42_5 [Harvfovirus sp.]
MSKPNNFGKKWTKGEEKMLLASLRRGREVSEMCKDFGRTYYGITNKLKMIVCELDEKGKSMNEIISATGLTEYDINGLIKKWTLEEEERLLEEIKRGMTITEISDEHKRNEDRIISKLKGIANNLYNEKVSIDEIVKRTRLNKTEVENLIKIGDRKKVITNRNYVDESDSKQIPEVKKEILNHREGNHDEDNVNIYREDMDANIREKIRKCKLYDKERFEIEGNMCYEDIKYLLDKQEFKCYVCEEEVIMTNWRSRCCYQFSIDRIDNSRPHDRNNVLISCYYCNCRDHPYFHQLYKRCTSRCHTVEKRNIINRYKVPKKIVEKLKLK